MIKRVYYKLRWLPSQVINRIQFKIKGITNGHNIRTLGSVFIRGKGRIIIGDNVTINSCMEANPIGGDRKTIFYIKKGAELYIGNNVGISNTALYSESCITIEDDVLIGNSCKIYDSNFHSTSYEERVSGKENVISKPIVIKRGAFIGANTIILKGVTIGEKSIIGAGSVVTKDIPDGEIWAGNPAKYIRDC